VDTCSVASPRQQTVNARLSFAAATDVAGDCNRTRENGPLRLCQEEIVEGLM
jgi:hypothetical protein